MGLEAAWRDLETRLQALHDALTDMRTVVEDRPPHDDVVLVDLFGDAADELLGWLAEAQSSAELGRLAAEHPVDLDRMRRAIAICQERSNRISYRFSSDLLHYERMAELTSFGQSRGGQWRGWADTVTGALDSCQQPLFDIGQALFVCWQEIAERIGMSAGAVQTTAVGLKMRPASSPDVVGDVPF